VAESRHPDRRLPARLYRYHTRISDRYNRRVVTLAVLADTSPRFRPGPYELETLGCRVHFEYPCCKLLDLDQAMLEREDNPAAVVILAHRAAQQRTRDPAQRKRLKWAVTRPLDERGYVIRDDFPLEDDSPPTGRELIEASLRWPWNREARRRARSAGQTRRGLAHRRFHADFPAG
jgi:hypothetical protein